MTSHFIDFLLVSCRDKLIVWMVGSASLLLATQRGKYYRLSSWRARERSYYSERVSFIIVILLFFFGDLINCIVSCSRFHRN